MAQKICKTVPKKRMLEDRGALTEEFGNVIREYQAMQEENVLHGWLRENVEGKAEEMENVSRAAKEEESKSGKREVEEKREVVEVNSKRVCFDGSLRLNSRGQCFELVFASKLEKAGSVCDVSQCFPMCLLI